MEGWVRGWSSSSRSGVITSARGCRSGRWRSAMGCIAGRCGRRWRRRCRRPKRVAGEPAGAEAGRVSGDDRRVADRRSRGAAQAAPHGQADPISAWSMSTAPRSRRSTVRAVRAGAQAAAGLAGRGRVRPAASRARQRGPRSTGARREVELAGAQVTVHLFVMRASFSGAAFCQASPVETQQAFLELHVAGVRVVRRRVRAGPLRQPEVGGQAGPQGPPARRVRSLRRAALALLVRVAVHDAGPRGRAREGRRRGRGRPLPPQPPGPGPEPRGPRRAQRDAAGGLRSRPGRRIAGRAGTIRQAWAIERPLLLALPAEAFDSAEAAAPRVDQKSLVTIRQNRYSVPVALAGLKVSARVGAREITISHGGQVVARHERLHGKFATSAQLDHYLELLRPQARRPGALRRARPRTRPRRLARLL